MRRSWSCVCGAFINISQQLFSFFSFPFIAFKITAIHIKTTLKYGHYKKALENNNITRWMERSGGGGGGVGGVIKSQTTKELTVEERISLFYPVKGVPGRKRDAHTHKHTLLSRHICGCVRGFVWTACTMREHCLWIADWAEIGRVTRETQHLPV